MNKEAEKIWKREFGDARWGFDECGARIRKTLHGEKGVHGWTKDHIVPKSRKGGTDALANQQPLHWMNNEAKKNAVGGSWRCAVRSREDKNGNLYNYSTETGKRL